MVNERYIDRCGSPMVVLLGVLLLLAAGPVAGQWSDRFARAPELALTAIAETPEGFVGAGQPLQFVNAAGEVEFHVLRFFENGRWRTGGAIDFGIFSGSITSVTPFRNDYCVGGNFTNFSPGGFNFIACYSTAEDSWYQPGGTGNGPNNAVNSVWFDGGIYLYIGGSFTEVRDNQGAPITASRVARTSGAEWEPLIGNGGATNGVVAPVQVVRTFEGFVFVASGSGVFRYNFTNTTWTPFGQTERNTSFGTVSDLAFFNNEVIATGAFDKIDSEPVPGIAVSPVASGPSWRTLDDGSQGPGFTVPNMAANSSFLYVTGPWPDLPGANGLARWDGFAWEAVDTTALDLGFALVATQVITQANADICLLHSGISGTEIFSPFVACKGEPDGLWRGTSQGIEGAAQVLEEYNGEVYAGGGFLSAGDDINAPVIARWDGARWSAVGNGVTGDIFSLAVFQGELYAAGNVSGAGGSATGGLVAWNGSTWRDAGGSDVLADNLYVFENALYFSGVGGGCGSGLTRVCRFNGSTLENTSSGFPEPISVSAIGEYNGQLAAAGNFRFENGTRRDVIALLDNGTWDVVIRFISGVGALALANIDGDLYFGGRFTVVDNAPGPLNRIGRWDGSNLFALGSGLDGGAVATSVQDIQLHDGLIYVAGDFDDAGGVTSRGIAAWDGSSWIGLNGGTIQTPFPALGSGSVVPGVGTSLLSRSEGLYIGGTFDQTGAVYAGNVALFTGDVVFSSGFEQP